jgi:hypothetical protein
MLGWRRHHSIVGASVEQQSALKRLCHVVVAGAFALTLGVSMARAADIPPPVESYPPVKAPVVVPELFDPNRWEIRFGGFAHGVGSVEKETWDVNGEFVFAKFFAPTGWWSVLVPRLHVGTNWNTHGRTDVVYGGLLWTVPITQRIFVEGFFDGAWTDGSLVGSPTQVALGCRAQFHVGGSIGYRLTPSWSIMGTFDHVSNGAGIGLSDCARNQGLNNYGARIGFSF